MAAKKGSKAAPPPPSAKPEDKRQTADQILAKLQFAKKRDLEARVILEDQIILVDNFLSAKECDAAIKAIDSLPLELTPPKRRGEAERVNYRFSVQSSTFAEHLRARLNPHLPAFAPSKSIRRSTRADSREAVAYNSNIRFYKYTPAQYFGPHYDDYVYDEETGQHSEWTLLVYLTGVEDGVVGGETIFYKDEKKRDVDAIVPELSRGTALLHRHGPDCMLHEGSQVKSGTKYVLRSDLMFKDI
ncbi:hypothetical protein CYLTODRAFT_416197 [Cylindrobasidium torrendii FP15055 ss-10]|uniref:Prolyl 4-hydroxylase alpha subunit domain-containing protein n=1 Tax=Cylindrobasidium torrendii FP15055 ss-10 TaxID=1314674 RepID=A0A0D7BVT4_9AGAR|nr:hypothetical protein CYLTODRAFT_416197 [Cylindrobasidium torrendii FP15055 ss-10]